MFKNDASMKLIEDLTSERDDLTAEKDKLLARLEADQTRYDELKQAFDD